MIIIPIPKTAFPEALADYRPLSIQPILSRRVEKEFVRSFLYPAFLKAPVSVALYDQFAFRPTGTTTAALITMLHHISYILRDNAHVTIISIDFSKAFNTVRHSTLMDKTAQMNVPDNK